MTTRKCPRSRAGYTLMEVLVVLAILIILAAILAPTFNSFSRDTKVKAATDTIMARIADARASAIERGLPYRLALSEDGMHIRIAPDDQAYANHTVMSDDEDNPLVAEADFPKDVTVQQIMDDEFQAVTDQAGWTRVATFLPDGTCREDLAVLQVREPGVYTILIRIRGLTGAATTSHGTMQGNNR